MTVLNPIQWLFGAAFAAAHVRSERAGVRIDQTPEWDRLAQVLDWADARWGADMSGLICDAAALDPAALIDTRAVA